PQPPDPWSGVRDATSFGSKCAQLDPGSGILVGSEDCLTLNVWTAAKPADGGLPVFVFLHGGANLSGSTVEHDFGPLAPFMPSVIVSVEYRLGPFGFLGHPALAAQDPNHSTGNYGILDQIAALQWVQRNISRFGGDPRRVLLGGQSAGGHDTAIL